MRKTIMLFAVFTFLSCTEQNDASKTEISTQTNHGVNSLKVSFISAGTGVDATAKKQFLKYFNEFEEQNKLRIGVEISMWGKEGEIDYCLDLSELRISDQLNFVLGVKEILQPYELVKLSENKKCENK